MKFGLFMATEFLHAFTSNLLLVVLFFGGWSGPFVQEIPLLGIVWLLLKVAVIYILSLILRATVPRVRIDQMMAFNWKFLVPVSIVNVIVIALLLQITRGLGLSPAPEDATNFVANLPQALILLAGNLLIGFGILSWLRNQGRRERLSSQVVARASGDEGTMVATPTAGR